MITIPLVGVEIEKSSVYGFPWTLGFSVLGVFVILCCQMMPFSVLIVVNLYTSLTELYSKKML